jgi:hypothetical protein
LRGKQLKESRNVSFPKRRRSGGRVWCVRRKTPVAVLLGLIAAALPSPVCAQESEGPEEESVSNLAAGRVEIVVDKDGIVIVTLENRIEPDTRPPLIVPLGSRRAGVLLGAVDWLRVDSGIHFARLDRDLPQLHGPTTTAALGPRLQKEVSGGVAGDIEDVGTGLFERLLEVLKPIHAKLDLPSQQPLVELVLADYIEGYGAEVWVLSYMIEQLPLRGDYWETRVLRPHYTQLWPPEKDQPRNLMEITYPPGEVSPPLTTLLRGEDPRVRRVTATDASATALAELLSSGDTRKALAADTVTFLRATLDAIATSGAGEVAAVISEQAGFDWILPPVEEAKKPGEEKQRPPGAPTLRKPPR